MVIKLAVLADNFANLVHVNFANVTEGLNILNVARNEL